jgi:hypothetical protein
MAGPAIFKVKQVDTKAHKKVMASVVNSMFALEFGSDRSPTQATGDDHNTPQEVVLYPLLVGRRLGQFASAAHELFRTAQHNEGGRAPAQPQLFNWSHVRGLSDHVQKIILRVHTHTHNATRVPVNTKPFL